MFSLGIDIGGTFIKYALVNNALEIVKDWEVSTPAAKTADDFYDYLVASMGELRDVTLIGVSAPGVIARDSTVTSIASPNVAIMYTTNINHEITARTQLPCFTMNDAKAAGYCELKLGAARDTESSMVFIIGTGLGGALTYKDHVLDGVDGYAGEFSRIPMLDSKGEFTIAAKLASATSLPEFYNERKPDSVESAKDVFTLFHKEDPIAVEVMNQWLNNIVFILGQLIAVYNPDVICIGGGVTKDKTLLDNINKAFEPIYRNFLFAQPSLSTRIVACEYLSHSNLMGAVLFAKEQIS